MTVQLKREKWLISYKKHIKNVTTFFAKRGLHHVVRRVKSVFSPLAKKNC